MMRRRNRHRAMARWVRRVKEQTLAAAIAIVRDRLLDSDGFRLAGLVA